MGGGDGIHCQGKTGRRNVVTRIPPVVWESPEEDLSRRLRVSLQLDLEAVAPTGSESRTRGRVRLWRGAAPEA